MNQGGILKRLVWSIKYLRAQPRGCALFVFRQLRLGDSVGGGVLRLGALCGVERWGGDFAAQQAE